MERIQIITILANLCFIGYIGRLIVKGKLREEYAIFWVVVTLFVAIFSFWRKGLEVMARKFGVVDAPNLVFTGFIFLILVYLLHLSVVNSKLQKSITALTQEMALLKLQNQEKNGSAKS